MTNCLVVVSYQTTRHPNLPTLRWFIALSKHSFQRQTWACPVTQHSAAHVYIPIWRNVLRGRSRITSRFHYPHATRFFRMHFRENCVSTTCRVCEFYNGGSSAFWFVPKCTNSICAFAVTATAETLGIPVVKFSSGLEDGFETDPLAVIYVAK